MQFIMNRIYLRIFGLTILLIQMALIGYTAFTVKELPHRYQQEFDKIASEYKAVKKRKRRK